jgi:hypothetical protein
LLEDKTGFTDKAQCIGELADGLPLRSPARRSFQSADGLSAQAGMRGQLLLSQTGRRPMAPQERSELGGLLDVHFPPFRHV